MPIGVQVQLKNTEIVGAFIEKLVERVLPKVRDFQGYSKYLSSSTGTPGTLTLTMPAETWTSFPEIESSYLKFPSAASPGSLQEFEIDLITSAKSDEQAKLLLSGFRMPFVWDEEVMEIQREPEPEFIHDV